MFFLLGKIEGRKIILNVKFYSYINIYSSKEASTLGKYRAWSWCMIATLNLSSHSWIISQGQDCCKCHWEKLNKSNGKSQIAFISRAGMYLHVRPNQLNELCWRWQTEGTVKSIKGRMQQIFFQMPANNRCMKNFAFEDVETYYILMGTI